MTDQKETALNKLSDAAARLEEGIAQAQDEIGRDGVNQRFEFTFEQMWKTLKIFLEYEGIKATTPRAVLQEAFYRKWINDEKVFLQMLKDRNYASQLYSEQKAQAIHKNILQIHLNKIKEVVIFLKKEWNI